MKTQLSVAALLVNFASVGFASENILAQTTLISSIFPTPCEVVTDATLVEIQPEGYEIRLSDRLADEQACMEMGARLAINPNERTYLVVESDRTENEFGTVKYLGRATGDEFFTLRDLRDSMEPRPQFARFTAYDSVLNISYLGY